MNRELYEISYIAKKERQHKIAVVLLFITIIFGGISLVRGLLLFPVRQRSISMQPDITVDSCVLFTPLIRSPERGSVVLLKPRTADRQPVMERIADVFISFFTAQQYALDRKPALMGSESQIRRVVGVPGDTIYMKGYIVFVKPAGEKHFLSEFELSGKSYNVKITASPEGWDSSIGAGGDTAQIYLGRDEYFVLGDMRNTAADSRLWGTVSSRQIRAKGIAVYFPFRHFKML
jgi:signal peptidase I